MARPARYVVAQTRDHREALRDCLLRGSVGMVPVRLPKRQQRLLRYSNRFLHRLSRLQQKRSTARCFPDKMSYRSQLLDSVSEWIRRTRPTRRTRENGCFSVSCTKR